MSLQDSLQDDLKNALRTGDTLRRSVLRYLRSEIHNQEIATQGALDDDAVLGLLSQQAQQRRDSIEAFKKGHRQDLVDKEESELAIILEYLPQQLTRDEIAEVVEKAVRQVGAAGPQDMGKLMRVVMPQLKGKAQGREVSSIASELLKSLSG